MRTKTTLKNEGITPEVDENKGAVWRKIGITPEV
jgi:hypothetical protein